MLIVVTVATGPCFIIKVWLVTLIGLTNSLVLPNVHVFLIKAVNSLVSNNGEILIIFLLVLYLSVLLNQSARACLVCRKLMRPKSDLPDCFL